LTGRITDSGNDPLVGATVQALQTRIVDGKFSITSVGQATTNDLGKYRIFQMPPGRYYLSAFYRDNASVFGLHGRSATKDQAAGDDSFED